MCVVRVGAVQYGSYLVKGLPQDFLDEFQGIEVGWRPQSRTQALPLVNPPPHRSFVPVWLVTFAWYV